MVVREAIKALTDEILMLAMARADEWSQNGLSHTDIRVCKGETPMIATRAAATIIVVIGLALAVCTAWLHLAPHVGALTP